VLELLLRFYRPTRGRILLGGVDLASLPEAVLRSSVAAVFQEPSLPLSCPPLTLPLTLPLPLPLPLPPPSLPDPHPDPKPDPKPDPNPNPNPYPNPNLSLIASQEPFLLAGSVRHNILFGARAEGGGEGGEAAGGGEGGEAADKAGGEAGGEERLERLERWMIHAAIAAGAHEFIVASGGYDQEVGERGIGC
jgi:ABC-type multidrug transport system fused ATPase/permease subunit